MTFYIVGSIIVILNKLININSNERRQMSVQVTEGRTVNINEAKRIVLKAFRKQRPIMLWGAPGIGKSDLVEQIATELNRDLIDIRLPLWEPTDI